MSANLAHTTVPTMAFVQTSLVGLSVIAAQGSLGMEFYVKVRFLQIYNSDVEIQFSVILEMTKQV